MSVVLVINPNTGEIMEELIATADYRSSKGVTVKPKTPAEEQRLRKISEDAKRIRLLREQLDEMDQELARVPSESTRQNRQSAAADIQNLENFAQAVHTIHRLQARAAELEQITVTIPDGDQTAELELILDEYTDHAHSALTDRLDKLSDAFQSSDPGHVRKTMQQLVEIEEALEALPDAARNACLQLIMRQELAQAVIGALADSGWSVSLEADGSASDATRITAVNSIGSRAAVIFTCDGRIYLETPGFTESARSSLQQLVLGTLHASGAKNATGQCLDSRPPMDPPTRTRAADAESRTTKERYL